MQTPHRLSPELVESLGQVPGQVTIPKQQRGEPPFRYERVIERKDDDVVIDYVKGMTKFPRIADSGHVPDVSTMFLQKLDQQWRRLVREAKDDLMVNLLLRRVAGDATKNRKAAIDGAIDRLKIAARTSA